MLIVTPKLDRYEIGAGEPFILSVVIRDKVDGLVDLTDRRFVLSFYRTSGRGLFAAIDGVPVGDGLLQFVRPGTFTESLFQEGLTVSLSERLLNGRETLASGKLTVLPTAEPVESFGSLIGKGEVRATVYLDDLGTVTKWGDLIRLPYASDGAPVIYTPAAISNDGTPQVGETFTGVDPTGNGPIVARRWIFAGVTVDTDETYTATGAGTLRYEADLQGPDGTIVTSGSIITVAAITLADSPIASTAPIAAVSGAAAAFETLNTTADEQDARLDQLEAA